MSNEESAVTASPFSKFFENASTASQHYSDFLQRRMQSNIDFVGSLSRCKTLPEFWRAWSDYGTASTNDYQKEFADTAKYWQSANEEITKAFVGSLQDAGKKLAALK
ncbi:phasin family protein [Hyphomicrobium sp. DY-1]|uniref:phasin family protein n=1 Tax=Hyphomicrobium sp. DY-1 TaxID=3075650 RepID=UPI0039C1F5E3